MATEGRGLTPGRGKPKYSWTMDIQGLGVATEGRGLAPGRGKPNTAGQWTYKVWEWPQRGGVGPW